MGTDERDEALCRAFLLKMAEMQEQKTGRKLDLRPYAPPNPLLRLVPVVLGTLIFMILGHLTLSWMGLVPWWR